MPGSLETYGFGMPSRLRQASNNQSGVVRRCQEMLRLSPYLAVRELKCIYHDGALMVRGSVPTYHTKQVAFALLRRVVNLKDIADGIEVE